jgi:hypothetical protein
MYLDGEVNVIPLTVNRDGIYIAPNSNLAFTINVSAYGLSGKVSGHAMYKIIITREGSAAATFPSFGNSTISRIGTPIGISYLGDSGSYALGSFEIYQGASNDYMKINIITTPSGGVKWVAHISGMEYSVA